MGMRTESAISSDPGTATAWPRPACRAPELARQAQQILDDFIRENRWHRRQQETVLRYDRDGEAFLRFFLAPDGTTRLRFIEPGQVATPSGLLGDPTTSFGIRTEPDDVETVLEYYVDGQAVPAADVQHRKTNVDANVKRGLPLFFPVARICGGRRNCSAT